MRVKDHSKESAITEATIKVVNRSGFDSASISKIAKEAGVSPATIYIYYKNKEDLIISTYIEIKKNVSSYVLDSFDPALPVRDIFERIWQNLFLYVEENPEEFKFKEQFANSPYLNLVNQEEVMKYFEPINQVLERGIREKIIKNADPELLCVFIFYPVMVLANQSVSGNFQITDEIIEQAYQMAWDAIKL